MKRFACLLLLVWLLSGTSWSAVHEGQVRLPETKGPVSAETTIGEFRKLLEDPSKLKLEELADGRILGCVERTEPWYVSFRDMRLYSLQVTSECAGGKFARWFRKNTEKLPQDNLKFDRKYESSGADSVLHEHWDYPEIRYKAVTGSAGITCRFTIWFGRSKTGGDSTSHGDLADSAGVAPDTAVVSLTDSCTVAGDSTMEVLPQPIDDQCPKPQMPEQAAMNGVHGRVVVHVYVDESGTVRTWRIVRLDPVGYGFAQAVERVILQWKFTPAIQRGKPVGVWVSIPFRF